MVKESDVFNEVIEYIKKGIKFNEYIVFAKKVSKGRFPEEVVLQIYVKNRHLEAPLLRIRIYRGYGVYYRPWVEFSEMKPVFQLGNKRIKYFDSFLEDMLLTIFSGPLPPGGKIYVEYVRDKETGEGLLKSLPIPVTRLGSKLFELGYTWFKDWYFPEGGLEGGEKLQGEKPLDEKNKQRHLTNILKENESLINKIESSDPKRMDPTKKKGYERAKKFLSTIS